MGHLRVVCPLNYYSGVFWFIFNVCICQIPSHIGLLFLKLWKKLYIYSKFTIIQSMTQYEKAPCVWPNIKKSSPSCEIIFLAYGILKWLYRLKELHIRKGKRQEFLKGEPKPEGGRERDPSASCGFPVFFKYWRKNLKPELQNFQSLPKFFAYSLLIYIGIPCILSWN